MNKKNIIFFVIFILFFNILINLLILNIFYPQKRIAVVDIAEIKKDYVNFVGNQHKLDKKSQEFLIENFTKEINKFIIQVSQDNNLIVLPKQAVFGGADVDLTTQLRSILIKWLKQKYYYFLLQ